MSIKKAVLISGALILSSCASQLHRGVVAMKVSDDTAHVGLNKKEVSIGDHVELYGNKCSGAKDSRTCAKIFKGHGTVVQVISDDYAAVKFDSGVVFVEGDFIEKHSH
jgi:hypothetical protein